MRKIILFVITFCLIGSISTAWAFDWTEIERVILQKLNTPSQVDQLSLQDFQTLVFAMMRWIGCLIWFLIGWTIIKRWLYRKSSVINKTLFILDIIFCHIISVGLIYFSMRYAVDLFAVIIGIFLLSADYQFWKAWRIQPQYPCQPHGLPPSTLKK